MLNSKNWYSSTSIKYNLDYWLVTVIMVLNEPVFSLYRLKIRKVNSDAKDFLPYLGFCLFCLCNIFSFHVYRTISSPGHTVQLDVFTHFILQIRDERK